MILNTGLWLAVHCPGDGDPVRAGAGVAERGLHDAHRPQAPSVRTQDHAGGRHREQVQTKPSERHLE